MSSSVNYVSNHVKENNTQFDNPILDETGTSPSKKVEIPIDRREQFIDESSNMSKSLNTKFEINLEKSELMNNDHKNVESTTEEIVSSENSQLLCIHEGVLLRKAISQYSKNLNVSGSLALITYGSSKRLYIEWKPNDNILIALHDTQEQGEGWALVDSISQRPHRISESNIFEGNPKYLTSSNDSSIINSEDRGIKRTHFSSDTKKNHLIQMPLDTVGWMEVKERSQTLRFIRKSDKAIVLEFFFQHGNAHPFVRQMRHLHVIERPQIDQNDRNGYEKYIILPTEDQKLRKTFVELDIGDIKARTLPNEGWRIPQTILSNLLSNFTYSKTSFGRYENNYKNAQYAGKKNRHGQEVKRRPTSLASPSSLSVLSSSMANENYDIVGFSDESTSDNISGKSGSSGSDKSALELDCSDVMINDNTNGITIRSDCSIRKQRKSSSMIICDLVDMNLPERKKCERGPPLSRTQWINYQTLDGLILQTPQILEIIFRGGIEPEVRTEVWKYLLKLYKWQSTEEERTRLLQEKTKEYYQMKIQWLTMTTMQEKNFSAYRDRKCQIDKDVKRTDRSLPFYSGENNKNLHTLESILMTYVMYNFDLGYVQGMSDLLAPILAVMGDEPETFWCFVGFMDLVLANFDIDQAGMKAQFRQLRRLIEFVNPRLFNYMRLHESDDMYFCFRWLLILYKREFSNDDILLLWECLWTRLPCANFHLFISLAILDQHTNVIIENRFEFTEILKYINELSGQIDLKKTLELAESIYYQVYDIDEALPNDIRQIIDLPPLEVTENSEEPDGPFSDDGFDELEREQTIEERKRYEDDLEKAYECSIFQQHI